MTTAVTSMPMTTFTPDDKSLLFFLDGSVDIADVVEVKLLVRVGIIVEVEQYLVDVNSVDVVDSSIVLVGAIDDNAEYEQHVDKTIGELIVWVADGTINKVVLELLELTIVESEELDVVIIEEKTDGELTSSVGLLVGNIDEVFVACSWNEADNKDVCEGNAVIMLEVV